MRFYSSTLAKILKRLPGQRLGIYKFLPVFFIFGAGLEFTMINWDVGGKVNFYRTYKKRKVQELAEEALAKTP